MIRDLIAELGETHPEASVTATVPETTVAETQPRIETALWEVLENAAKHAGREPTIDIDVTTTDERVLIDIRDDGPGLPETERQVLVTGEEGPLIHGQGLGLFLTHWIITNLDGEVSVTTNGGTSIEVRLPIPSTTADTGTPLQN